LPRTSAARFFGVGARRFFRLFTPGATHQRRIRIVDSCGDVFSDPGATPGASTIFFRGASPLELPYTVTRSRWGARSVPVDHSLRSFAPVIGASPLGLPYTLSRSHLRPRELTPRGSSGSRSFRVARFASSHSAIVNPSIGNRQSPIRRSAICNRQSPMLIILQAPIDTAPA
jgi:hypothetical protein